MHTSTLITLFLGVGTLALPNPLSSLNKNTECSKKVKMISARGTGAPPGPGGFQIVANSVISTLAKYKPVLKAVDYPATETNPAYMDSVAMGAHDAQAQIIKAVDRCPDVNIVLFGYSKGANVVLDAAFGSINSVNLTQPLPAKYQAQIKAIVVMGDPTHYEPQTFVQGTVQHSGVIPRMTNFDCSPLTGRIMSFCDDGDPYCSNGNNITAHNSYFTRYSQQALSFTLERLQASL